MKHSSRSLSKKGIEDLIRITNKSKKRVWLFQGKEYDTLREVVIIHGRQEIAKLITENKKSKKE